MEQTSIIQTSIEGLLIKLNKVIVDERGYLAELMPGGLENEFCKGGFKNLYLSTATSKHIARGGHFHKFADSYENFYCVSGLALWLFYDFRNHKISKPFFAQTSKYKNTQTSALQNLNISDDLSNLVIVLVGEKNLTKKYLTKETLQQTTYKYFLPEVMAQIVVPPGVYHIYFSLSDEPVKIVAVHSKNYDPRDYQKIELADIPNSAKMLAPFKIKI